MSSDHLLSRKAVDAQYRPRGYGLSPGLQRARAPYRVRNALTGLIVGGFAVSVWAYSIRAVKQDSFEDVDEEAKAMLSARTQQGDSAALASGSMTGTSTGNVGHAAAPLFELSSSTSPVPISSPSEPSGVPVGLLSSLIDQYLPRLLDPNRKTLIWGAPPVDRMGRLGDTVDRQP